MILPSRFQIGDNVLYREKVCIITEVSFTEGKVYYILNRFHKVDSCDVEGNNENETP